MTRPELHSTSEAVALIRAGLLTRAQAVARYSLSITTITRALKRAGVTPMRPGRPRTKITQGKP
jgi:hypothetical protein